MEDDELEKEVEKEIQEKIARGKELEEREKELQDFIIRTLGKEDKEVQEYIQVVKKFYYTIDHALDNGPEGFPQDFLIYYLHFTQRMYERAMKKYRKDVN